MKFKAFTLLEIIIASLITGIIGFIIIYFLEDVLMVTKIQNAAQEQEEELAVFDLLLTNDLFLSDTILVRNGNLEIKKDTSQIVIQQQNTEITYIRGRDTSVFYLPIEHVKLNANKDKQVIEVSYLLGETSVQAKYIDEADYLK